MKLNKYKIIFETNKLEYVSAFCWQDAAIIAVARQIEAGNQKEIKSVSKQITVKTAFEEISKWELMHDEEIIPKVNVTLELKPAKTENFSCN